MVDLIRPPFLASSQRHMPSNSSSATPTWFLNSPSHVSTNHGPLAAGPIMSPHHTPRVTGTGYSSAPSSIGARPGPRNKSRVPTPSAGNVHVPVETCTLTFWVEYPYGSGTTCRVAFVSSISIFQTSS